MKLNRVIPICIFLGLTVAWSSAQMPTPVESLDSENLIKLLGSQVAAQREAATRELMRRDRAVPLLRAATKSADVEVARRAELVLREIFSRPGLRDLECARECAARGQVDLLFEYLSRLEKGKYEEECWKLFCEFGLDVFQKAEKRQPPLDINKWQLPGPPSPLDSSGKLMVGENIDFPEPKDRTDGHLGHFWVRARNFTSKRRIGRSLILATGTMQAAVDNDVEALSNSFAYAGESTKFKHGTAVCSLIFCDGDVLFSEARSPSRTVIIARGGVTFGCVGNAGPSSCYVVAGREIKFLDDSVAVQSTIIERERRPLGFLKFFELADLGIHLFENAKGLHVNDLDVKKPFAVAGVKALDKILGADGKELRTYETLRRYVRGKWMSEEPITLQIDRDGMPIEVRVNWK